MTSSKILSYLCLAFIVGIFAESIIKISQFVLWIFLFLSVALIFSKFLPWCRNHAIAYFLHHMGFLILLFMLGVLRMQISEFNIANGQLKELNDGPEEIVLTGVVAGEPDVREKSQKLKIEVGGFLPYGKKPPTSVVLVTASRYPEFNYLDKVKLTGKLKTPMETEDFSYKNYLMKDHIYSVMDFPKIETTGKKNPNFVQTIYFGVLWFKDKMRRGIRSNFPVQESYLLEGIILGDKNAISQGMKDKFKITGLSHVIAVSGTHVVILGAILMPFLLALGFWRSQAFYFAVIFICLYIVLVGLPPSGVRAGIMGVIFLFSQKIGRQATGSRVIVLACSLMLLQNPLLLFYDVGFQLSFLAVLGLIYLEPLIRGFLKLWVKKHESALMMVSGTIAAQIFTLPVIVFNFGNISYVSLFTNLLILPVVYYIMVFGFLSAVAGAILGGFAWLISLPCYFLLSYFLWVVDIFSQSWAYKVVENVSWIWLAISYLFLGFVVRYLNKRYKMRFVI